jgi:hypothetical protein
MTKIKLKTNSIFSSLNIVVVVLVVVVSFYVKAG